MRQSFDVFYIGQRIESYFMSTLRNHVLPLSINAGATCLPEWKGAQASTSQVSASGITGVIEML